MISKYPFKALFVDLDGTLLNSEKRISKKDINCLNGLVENKIPVIIATGRTIKSVKKVTGELTTHYPVITLNGSDIRQNINSHSMVIYYLEKDITEALFNFSLHALLNSTDYKIKNILVDTGHKLYFLKPHSPCSVEFFNHYDDEPDLLDLFNPPTQPVVSFLFLLTDDSNREAFIEAQKKLLPQNTKVCTFNGWPWIEIGSPHINKGEAMKIVCAYLNISIQDTIAFGDGENDVEMLASAGFGVSMANADKHAMSAAKYKTCSNDMSGVSHFIESL